jgi:RNA polymerase sigma factor (sigma-70 family)
VPDPAVALLSETGEFGRAVKIVAAGGPQAESAFSELFSSYAGKIRSYVATRIQESADVDDVVQETFIRFLRSIRGGRHVSHASYLWSVANSVLIDRHRMRTASNRDVTRTVEFSDELGGYASGASESHEDHELLDCVRGSLAEFATRFPEHSSVIELAILEQWTVSEIATFLERTRGATRQYLYECRKKLRAMVLERCADLM